MGLHDAEFLPSRAIYSTTFLKKCGSGECLGTTTCHKTVAGVSQGMLPVKDFRSIKVSSLC